MKRGRSEQYALEEQEINRLWRTCRKLEDKVLIGLLTFEGLRISEAIHVRSTWIRGGAINIPDREECRCSACSTLGYWRPKSAAGVRSIPIVEALEPHLLTFLQHQPNGLGYSRIAAWKRVKALAQQAGIGYITPHALRATYATTLARNNISAAAICFLLGWASISMGQHYINIAQAKAEAQKVRQLFTAVS